MLIGGLVHCYTCCPTVHCQKWLQICKVKLCTPPWKSSQKWNLLRRFQSRWDISEFWKLMDDMRFKILYRIKNRESCFTNCLPLSLILSTAWTSPFNFLQSPSCLWYCCKNLICPWLWPTQTCPGPPWTNIINCTPLNLMMLCYEHTCLFSSKVTPIKSTTYYIGF